MPDCKTLLFVSLFGFSGSLLASGGPPGGMRLPDVDYDFALAQIKAGQFEAAIPPMQAYLERKPEDADAHNWLAYSLRKLQRYAPAEQHYLEALKLDPRHLGAHEYLGELYVETGLLDKARSVLASLVKLCPEGCEERRELQQALDQGTTRY